MINSVNLSIQNSIRSGPIANAFYMEREIPCQPCHGSRATNSVACDFRAIACERQIRSFVKRFCIESILRKGNSPEMDETQGFQNLGHSNWTICSLLSQFCFPNFTTFSLLYWEANSYYPRGLIMGKGNSHNSRNG